MDLRFTIYDLRLITSVEERTTSAMPVWFAPRASRFPSPRPCHLYVFTAPTRIAAGARDLSRRNVSTTQTRSQYSKAAFAPQHPCGLKSALRRSRGPHAKQIPPWGRGRMLHYRSAKLSGVSGRRTSRIFESAAACPLSPWERARVRGIGLPLNAAARTFPATVELCDSSGNAGGFV